MLCVHLRRLRSRDDKSRIPNSPKVFFHQVCLLVFCRAAIAAGPGVMEPPPPASDISAVVVAPPLSCASGHTPARSRGHSRASSLDLEAASRNAASQEQCDDGVDTRPRAASKEGDQGDSRPFLMDWKVESAGASRLQRLGLGLDFSLLCQDPGVGELVLARSRLQRAFVYTNMSMPAITMIVCLYGMSSIWLAAISFHAISCILMPVAYVLVCVGVDGFGKLCRSTLVHIRVQLIWGAGFFVVGGMVGLAGYSLVVRKIVPSNRDAVVDLGLSEDPSTLGLFGMYFSVVNPIVEELFWRGFCVLVMKNTETHPLWISAVSYASYHVVVLAAIGIQPEFICLCFAMLVIAGRVFSWMHHTTGLWSAVLAHAGADVVIVGALFDWYYSWLQRRRDNVLSLQTAMPVALNR